MYQWVTPLNADRTPRVGPPPPTSPYSASDRDQDSSVSQQYQDLIDSGIEYGVANSFTTPQATDESGPIDSDRSKYEAGLASCSLDTADANKVLSQQNEGNGVEVEDYSFRHVLLSGLFSDKNSEASVSESPKNICTKDTGDKTMGSSLTQKQHESMVDSFSEFDSGFVQSPPGCSESELEFASPTVDTCQNNIASSHPLPDTCQNIPNATETKGVINTGVVSDLSRESEFNAELSPVDNNSSTGDVPVAEPESNQKSKTVGDGLDPVNKNDKVCDLGKVEPNSVKSLRINGDDDDTCKIKSEQNSPNKDGNFSSNNIKSNPIQSDLIAVLCDVNDSLMNINQSLPACVEPDNHGSKDSNNTPCNLHRKTITLTPDQEISRFSDS